MDTGYVDDVAEVVAVADDGDNYWGSDGVDGVGHGTRYGVGCGADCDMGDVAFLVSDSSVYGLRSYTLDFYGRLLRCFFCPFFCSLDSFFFCILLISLDLYSGILRCYT